MTQQRRGAGPGRTPPGGDGDELCTPPPPEDDDDLVFLSHSPLAEVEPLRPEDKVQDSFVVKFEQKRRESAPPPAPGPPPPARPRERRRGITGRLRAQARRLGEGAGRGALNRVVDASRRAAQRPAPARSGRPPAAPQRPVSGGPRRPTGAQGKTPGTPEPRGPAGAAAPAPPPSRPAPTDPPPAAVPAPSFASLVPGALVAPLKGLPVVLVHALLLGLAGLLLELSPLMGLLALAIALGELVALRVRLIRDASSGELAVGWPPVEESLGAGILHTAAWLVFVPAIVLGFLAWGPGAYDATARDSLAGRTVRVLAPDEAALQAEGAALGHATYLMLEAAIGSGEPPPSERSTAELARALTAHAGAHARSFIDLDAASLFGLGARAALFLGTLLYPMALLCAVRLRSAYGALHLPLILRSVLHVPGSYLLVLLAVGVQDAAVLGASLATLPVFHEQLGPAGGHAVWLGTAALVTVVGSVATASLLGRLYHGQRAALAWE